MRVSVTFLVLLAGVLACNGNDYQGHKLYRVVPRDQAQVDFLDDLLKTDGELDFWAFPVAPMKNVDIHVSPDKRQAFEELLEASDMEFKIVVQDFSSMLAQEKVSARSGGFDSDYHSLSEIHAEILALAKAYSSVASNFSLGKSYENRDQLAIKINKGGSKKNLFFFNCGIHAREWISPATCMYMIRKILETGDSDSDVTDMLDNYEWVILPVLNVDGYEYTRTKDRMWRKTRTPGTKCVGVDPNRNFNYRFGVTGTSNNECSQIYRGKQAFSEKVTYNVAKFLYENRHRLKGYIDFHAYSQMFLSPWGYTDAKPSNYTEHMKAMTAAVNALQAVHGTRYVFGPASTTIYPTAGDTTDWTYGVLGCVHSYCVELRPTGNPPGFILPPAQIIPTGQETFAALKALVRNM
ncbi:carboxypeptidase B [Nematostella vectensis]|uniref:carboxypeptidase B n=1 Tax=Nematostella vectensis TaxID=45351 RepID=UPI00138FE933|nr:carboxypeptidase B [Nematostella vectensis]